MNRATEENRVSKIKKIYGIPPSSGGGTLNSPLSGSSPPNRSKIPRSAVSQAADQVQIKRLLLRSPNIDLSKLVDQSKSFKAAHSEKLLDQLRTTSNVKMLILDQNFSRLEEVPQQHFYQPTNKCVIINFNRKYECKSKIMDITSLCQLCNTHYNQLADVESFSLNSQIFLKSILFLGLTALIFFILNILYIEIAPIENSNIHYSLSDYDPDWDEDLSLLTLNGFLNMMLDTIKAVLFE